MQPETGPHLLDSALGTRLAALGLDFKADDPSLWNLNHPDAVLQCHAADLAAGAEYLTTNTFGANRHWLEKYGRAGEIGQINSTAVALARQAFADQHKPARIIGNIGPTALESRMIFQEQAELLAGAGVDLILLETLTAPQALTASAWLDQMQWNMPVWMSLWHWGDQPATVAKIMHDAGVGHWGLNCIADKKSIQSIFQTLFDANLQATLLKPSALEINLLIELAHYCRALGARYFGGCCGTNAEHIHALRAAWNINATPS